MLRDRQIVLPSTARASDGVILAPSGARPLRVKIGPLIARIGRKYVSNRLKAEEKSERHGAETDQPHELRRST
jgi:hypothetical protein